ncbi:MAG: hypothetical protein R3E83_06745 [Burkholderiaceae bacterium]
MALISNRSIDELDVRLAPVRLPVLALGGRQWRGTPAQPAEVRRFADCATALAEGLGDDPHFAGRDLCVVGPANAALIDLDLDRAAPADDETASAEMISALSTALAQRLS